MSHASREREAAEYKRMNVMTPDWARMQIINNAFDEAAEYDRVWHRGRFLQDWDEAFFLDAMYAKLRAERDVDPFDRPMNRMEMKARGLF